MRRLVIVIAGGLFWLGWQALLPSPAGAELKLSIRGQIRFNTIYADQIYGSGQTISPSSIRFDSGANRDPVRDNNQTIIDARRTRFWFDAKDTIAGDIKLESRVQVDFNTTDGNALVSNSRHLRLRLAYGQGTTPNGFTLRAGQVRTLLSEYGDNLIGGVAAAGVVNENGHFNQLQARQPAIQVAWTGKMGDGDLTLGAAIEKQGVDLKSTTGIALGSADPEQGAAQDIPLFAAGARYRSKLFAVLARGGASQARVVLSGTGNTEEEGVWMGAIGAEVKPMPMLKLYGEYWYSDGLNRINGTFDDVALVGGDLEAVQAQAFHVGGQLRLTKRLRFNAVYQWLKADADRDIFNLTATSSDKERIQALNVNFIYNFWIRWDTGFEYMYGRVDSFGDSEGDINIVNFRLRFYF